MKACMSLGDLIDALKRCPQSLPVRFDEEEQTPYAGQFYSYRGYYEDIALELSASPSTVAGLLQRAEAAVGQTFEGWKGGDYTMDRDSRLWVVSEQRYASGIRPVTLINEGNQIVIERIQVE